jgi:hypothetical protein
MILGLLPFSGSLIQSIFFFSSISIHLSLAISPILAPVFLSISKARDVIFPQLAMRSFISILNFDIEELKQYVIEIIPKLPREYSVVLAFLSLTGLRANEGINAIEVLLELSEYGKLDKYLNRNLMMLEHFKYPNIFLRDSKNAFISFINNDLLSLIIDTKPQIKYPTLYTKTRRLGYKLRTKDLRKLYATILRNNMIPSEVIDILQGRISSSIFIRFYYKPFLQEIRQKVMVALAPLKKQILEYL